MRVACALPRHSIFMMISILFSIPKTTFMDRNVVPHHLVNNNNERLVLSRNGESSHLKQISKVLRKIGSDIVSVVNHHHSLLIEMNHRMMKCKGTFETKVLLRDFVAPEQRPNGFAPAEHKDRYDEREFTEFSKMEMVAISKHELRGIIERQTKGGPDTKQTDDECVEETIVSKDSIGEDDMMTDDTTTTSIHGQYRGLIGSKAKGGTKNSQRDSRSSSDGRRSKRSKRTKRKNDKHNDSSSSRDKTDTASKRDTQSKGTRSKKDGSSSSSDLKDKTSTSKTTDRTKKKRTNKDSSSNNDEKTKKSRSKKVSKTAKTKDDSSSSSDKKTNDRQQSADLAVPQQTATAKPTSFSSTIVSSSSARLTSSPSDQISITSAPSPSAVSSTIVPTIGVIQSTPTTLPTGTPTTYPTVTPTLKTSPTSFQSNIPSVDKLTYSVAIPTFTILVTIEDSTSTEKDDDELSGAILDITTSYMTYSLLQEYDVTSLYLSISEQSHHLRRLEEVTVTSSFIIDGIITFESSFQIDPVIYDSLFEPFFIKFFGDTRDFATTLKTSLQQNGIDVIGISIEPPSAIRNPNEEEEAPYGTTVTALSASQDAGIKNRIMGFVAFVASVIGFACLLYGFYRLYAKYVRNRQTKRRIAMTTDHRRCKTTKRETVHRLEHCEQTEEERQRQQQQQQIVVSDQYAIEMVLTNTSSQENLSEFFDASVEPEKTIMPNTADEWARSRRSVEEDSRWKKLRVHSSPSSRSSSSAILNDRFDSDYDDRSTRGTIYDSDDDKLNELYTTELHKVCDHDDSSSRKKTAASSSGGTMFY